TRGASSREDEREATRTPDPLLVRSRLLEVDVPETRFVAVGDADVAYQVVGNGDVDLLYFYGLGSHIELFWESPTVAGFLTRLASFSRLMFFDRRGTGASDGVAR